MALILADLAVDVYTVQLDQASGFEAISGRLATQRLSVFNTLPKWMGEYRRFRKDEKGEVEGGVLMRATALLALHGAEMAISERETTQAPPDDHVAAGRGRSRTGY